MSIKDQLLAIRLYTVEYFSRLYVYLPTFLAICLWFFSKDHAYTSIEDSMAIGDPKVGIHF